MAKQIVQTTAIDDLDDQTDYLDSQSDFLDTQ